MYALQTTANGKKMTGASARSSGVNRYVAIQAADVASTDTPQRCHRRNLFLPTIPVIVQNQGR